MAGHWYDLKGNPTYTVIGANGKKRDTTLRDARKLHLVPSVTTIMGVEDKPGLLVWKQQQLLKACMACPYDEEIYEEEFWKKKVITESEMIGKNAADKGTKIHDALEQVFLGKDYEEVEFFSPKLDSDGRVIKDNYYKLSEFIDPVVEFMRSRFANREWIPEASFASPYGFGGKVDMHDKGLFHTETRYYKLLPGEENETEEQIGQLVNPEEEDFDYKVDVKVWDRLPAVLDYKTKDTYDRKKMVAYDQHHMQTAAYANGFEIENAERYNLFISTHVPGIFELTESTDFEREFGMFSNLMQFWQLKNNYVPYLESNDE